MRISDWSSDVCSSDLLTGDEFDVATALRLGFVQEVTEPGGQFAAAMTMAQRIAAQAPLAVAATLRNARLAVEHGPAVAVEDFRPTQAVLMRRDRKSTRLNSSH